MIVRTATGPAEALLVGAADRLAVRRAALWALLAAKLVAGWGVRWDIEWHVRIAHAIARKNRTGPGVPVGLAFALALVPAAAMTAADARRRPLAATAAYAVAAFAVSGLLLARSPAFQPMVPGVGATLAGLAVTLAAAVIGGLAARRLADAVGDTSA